MKIAKTLFQVVIIVSVFAAASCTTAKRCFEKFPPVVTVVTKYDTITEYQRDTVEIHIAGDTVIVRDTVIVEAGGLPFSADTLRAEVDYASAEAWVRHGSLGLMLYQKDTLLIVERDSMSRLIRYYKEKYEQSVVEKPIKKIPLLYAVLPFIVIALSLLLILLLLFRR